MWLSDRRPGRRTHGRTAVHRTHRLTGPELLEDRSTPANLHITGATLVDASDVAQPNPVYGQMIYVQATWTSQAMTGTEAAVPVRYTANYPADYFRPGSAAVSYPADSSAVYHGTGGGSWFWWRGGWYAGTGAFTVTVTVDPDGQVAETDETDNTLTLTVTPVAPTTLPNKFVMPIGKQANADWAINNYADIDPRSGSAADYRGGPYQYDGHDAIDAGPWGFDSQDAGFPIYAAADGVVTEVLDGLFDRQAASSGLDGNHVRISHGSQWETLYYHFAANSITVKVGDTVKAGQLIGLMGSSGNSTGTHLHYTAYYRGCQVEAGFAPSSYWLAPLPYGGDVTPFAFTAGVTNYNPGADGQEKVSPVGTFPTSGSGTLYFWLQTYGLHTTDVLGWQWYRPNGTLYASNTFSSSQDFRFSWWWWTRSLSDFQSAAGTWQVAYLINGVEQKRVSFTVNATGEPSLRLANSSDQILLDGRTTPVDFGPVAQGGAGPQRAFTVRNHGYGNLTLANFVAPAGFTVVSAPATVAAGTTGTITVRLDSAAVGTKFGSLRFDTNDPDIGTFELNLTGAVTGSPPAGAPAIDLDGSPTATINPATAFNYQSLPRLLSPAATLTAGAANFNGGSLRVEFASFGAADDRLAVRNQGTAAGQIGVSGTTVTFGGTAIGTLAGGVGTAPFVVTLNAAATVAATQALLQNLTYQNVGPATTQRKAVRYTLADGGGLVSNLAVQHVANSGVARNPVVAGLPARTVVRGTSLGTTGSFTDPNASGWTATVDYGDGSGAQPLTLNADKTFALSHLYTAAVGTYSATVTITSDIGGTATAVLPVTIVAPVGVASVAVNGGDDQRSRVPQITVTFTGLVTLPTDPATAFELTGPSGTITLAADLSGSTPTQTVVKLTYSGAGTESGSLADGRYTLRVKGTLAVDQYGAAADGDGDGLADGDGAVNLHRLFGDSDGDGDVDALDYARARAALNTHAGDPNYQPMFDWDADGDVDALDYARVRARLNTRV